MRKVLVPPPATKADEIVAAMGGTYYAAGGAAPARRSSTKGAHFEKGDPLYIIEVMKMFNKVYAPFAGTVTEVLVESGTSCARASRCSRSRPTRSSSRRIPAERERRLRANTDAYLARLG